MLKRKKAEVRNKPAVHPTLAKANLIDKVGPTGVYPMSGPHPKGDALMVWPGAWGQGKRGPEGYQDHGESELHVARVIPEKCRDIMTKDPAFCQASDSILIAAKLMEKHLIGAIPVIENLRTAKLAGIVTDRDITIRAVAAGLDPHKTPVEKIMTKDVVTCSPDDDYRVALERMEQHQVKRIPAIDKLGRVVGIITEADIALRVPDHAQVAELVTSIAQPC